MAYQHGGFSVDTGVCIQAHDRAGLERLLRYCARPPFSMERLRQAGSELGYRCAKQSSEPSSDKRGAKVDELHLTPLDLIDRIDALVLPPRFGKVLVTITKHEYIELRMAATYRQGLMAA